MVSMHAPIEKSCSVPIPELHTHITYLRKIRNHSVSVDLPLCKFFPVHSGIANGSKLLCVKKPDFSKHDSWKHTSVSLTHLNHQVAK